MASKRIFPPSDTAMFEVTKHWLSGQWRWRLRALNGKIIAVSGEAYHNRTDCLHAIELVREATTARTRFE